MDKRMRRKKKPVILVLDAIIGLLSILFVFAAVFAVRAFYEEFSWAYDSESFYYRLQDEAYASMVEMYYSNEALGIEADEELEQYYSVARYFEAAAYYRMYSEYGDTARQSIYLRDMESAKEAMGQLSFVSDKILDRLSGK